MYQFPSIYLCFLGSNTFWIVKSKQRYMPKKKGMQVTSRGRRGSW